MDYEVKKFWDQLGSAWGSFENQEMVENYWNALSSGIGQIFMQATSLHLGRYLETMPELVDLGPHEFFIIYSGLETDVNVTSLSSGIVEYELPKYTVSIPTFSSKYMYNGVAYSENYLENMDYTISGYNYLLLEPHEDPRFTNFKATILYTSNLYCVNPALLDVWGRFIKYYPEYIDIYNQHTGNPYKHAKYMIWALNTLRRGKCTTKNLETAYGILHGLPFAYNSGTLDLTQAGGINSTVSVGDDDYLYWSANKYTVSGITEEDFIWTWKIDGDNISQFDLLCTDVVFHDYSSNPTLFNIFIGLGEYPELNRFSKRNIILVERNQKTLTGTSYSEEFLSEFMEDMIPSQIKLLYL
jgi:hypothetical protein